MTSGLWDVRTWLIKSIRYIHPYFKFLASGRKLAFIKKYYPTCLKLRVKNDSQTVKSHCSCAIIEQRSPLLVATFGLKMGLRKSWTFFSKFFKDHILGLMKLKLGNNPTIRTSNWFLSGSSHFMRCTSILSRISTVFFMRGFQKTDAHATASRVRLPNSVQFRVSSVWGGQKGSKKPAIRKNVIIKLKPCSLHIQQHNARSHLPYNNADLLEAGTIRFNCQPPNSQVSTFWIWISRYLPSNTARGRDAREFRRPDLCISIGVYRNLER